MLDFHVGQKVVCVDASGIGWDRSLLSEGAVYTICWIGEPNRYFSASNGHHACPISLRLLEARRLDEGAGEPGFRASRFRPLIETDISIFQAMLAPKPVKQPEGSDA